MIYVVYFSNAGTPATGLSPAIGIYKKVSDGTDVTPVPPVSEIGGGFYRFTAAPAEAMVIRMNGGGSLADPDKYKVMQITPHDGDLDAQVSTRAAEANVQGHVAEALAAYDPPTRAEATSDQEAILAAIAGLNDITVGELLAGNLSDSLSFPANSLADLIRKLFWVLCNRMVITDASGAFTAYKTDGVTPAVSGTITDNGAITERSEPTWP
jgi:hypothetical protein